MTDITNGRTLPTTRAGGPRLRRRLRRAFTLVEMLVVISIISLLCGIGFSVYFGLIRSTALNSEMRAVMGIVQSARSAAAAGGETFIRVDTANNRLHVFERVRVGVWHFEMLNASGTPGAFGHTAVAVDGGATLAEGKVGKALALDGSYRLKCKMNLGEEWAEIPGYDAHEGVAIEAWVMPADTDADTGTMTVISRGGWFALSLVYDADTKRFALDASVIMPSPDGAEHRNYTASTAPVVRPNEWTHVSISCHKLNGTITLRVDGVAQDLVDNTSGAVEAPSSDAETIIGGQADGDDPFKGRIDELDISAYAANDVHQITGKLKLEAAGLAAGDTVRFDSSGKLDSVHGGTTPKLMLKDYQGQAVKSSVVISIGAMGALDVDVSHN